MKMTLVLISVLFGLFSFAESPQIRNVTAKQRYPWNGKVDVAFEVEGDVTAGFPDWNKPILSLSATDRTTGSNYVATASALYGDTSTAEGVHNVVWDLDAQGLAFLSDDVVFSVVYVTHPLYCVIDLSAGSTAASYPAIYMDTPPSGGFNTDEYKTTKLALRLIELGSFKMCGQYDVTLTKPYYCSLFEVTQKQYELVTGGNPSSYKGDMRPVENVSYKAIRGSYSGVNWPSTSDVDSSSFLGKLRARTGIDGFDLPTEAQWEYACRAGTTSDYNNGGNTGNDLKQLGRYWGNQSDGKGGYSSAHTTVGSYLPNAWGLYDMHGNVCEWCRDWYGNLSSGVTDPNGSSSGSDRLSRGGSWGSYADYCTSSYRYSDTPSIEAYYYGFRLVRTLSDTESEHSPVAAAGAERAGVICAAESVPVAIDSRSDVCPVLDSVILPWNAGWAGGDANAVVVIADNGTEVQRVTGTGEFTYAPSVIGHHDLTYTTLVDGVVQEDTYSATIYAKWKYEVAAGGAIITETTQTCGAVTIPSEIDGYSVTGLAYGLFAGCDSLTDVTMPAYLLTTMVGADQSSDGALFSEIFPDSYTNLRTVALEGTILEIPAGTFAGCAALTGVALPDGVTRIAPGAFDGCVSLISIDLPDTLTDWGLESLPPSMRESFEFDDAGHMIVNGWLLDCRDRTVSTLTVPEGVVGIGNYALSSMYDLKTVSLPISLKYIADSAFRECTYLDNLELPAGVELIGPNAFMDCSYLHNLAPIAEVKSVGEGAFTGCTQLTGIAFGEGLETIGDEAFSGCWRMQYVTLPLSVEEVSSSAFTGCTTLSEVTVATHGGMMSDWFEPVYSQITHVTVPDGETEIRAEMFTSCVNLATVSIPEGVTNIVARAFKGCRALTEVPLPSTCIELGEEAFVSCSSLKSVVLPLAMERIGAMAFSGCSALSTLTLSRNLTEIPDRAFAGCSSLDSFVVPASVTRLGSRFVPSRTMAIYYLGNAPDCAEDVYADTRSDLTSYVVQDTLGWDGRPNSRDIPQSWNGRAIATWTPNRFDVTFDAMDGQFLHTEVETFACEQITGTGYVLPPFDPVRTGYTFGGYWTAESGGTRVTTSTRVTLTMAHILYARWIVDVPVTVLFNAMGGMVTPAESEYASGAAYGTLPVPTREHFTFAGWYTDASDGLLVTEVSEVPSAAHELFAYWAPCLYSIHYNANGGSGDMDDQSFTYGDTVILRENTFTKANNSFSGWALEAGGAAVYADGLTLTDLPALQDGVINLYAVWSPNQYAVRFDSNGGMGEMDNQTFMIGVTQTLSACLFSRTNYNFIGWGTEPNGEAVYYDMQSVSDLTDVQNETVTLYAIWRVKTVASPTVTPGDGAVFTEDSCTVTLSCATEGATIYYGINASPRPIARFVYSGPFTITDSATIFAFAIKDGVMSDPVTKATITKRLLTIGEAAGADMSSASLPWTTGGDADWTPVVLTGLDSISPGNMMQAVQSGEIGDAWNGMVNTTWIETSVAGAGTLSFVWKVDCEEDYISHEATWDHVVFLTNGVEVARMDGDSGWKTFSITFTDAGLHTNRWIFVKDDFNEEDFRDRAWLSEVRWIPYVATEDVVVDIGGGKTVTVPAAWLAEKTTRAATDVAANGRKVWECYVLGLDPENKFDCFRITSLPMKMDGTPDLDRITFEPPQSQWNVPGATVKVKGKVNLTDTQWQDVPAYGNSAFRFFRVEVVLP